MASKKPDDTLGPERVDRRGDAARGRVLASASRLKAKAKPGASLKKGGRASKRGRDGIEEAPAIPRARELFPRDHSGEPRDKLLERISGVTRIGTVEGVHFDLRHEQLDPVQCVTETLGKDHDWNKRRYPGRPFLWFPWYGEYTPELPKSMARDEGNWRNLSTAKKLALVEELTPEHIVCPGDRISIQRCESMEASNYTMRDVIDDEAVRLAYLQITKLDGAVVIVGTPMRFFSRDRFLTFRTNLDFYTLRNTIEKYLRDTKIRDTKKGFKFNRFALEADRVAFRLHLSLPGSEEFSAKVRVLELVNMGIRLGQLWTKAGAATSVLPLAELAERSRLIASESGKKSGKSRRLNAPWKPFAREAAKATRQSQPELSQDNLAEEIKFMWGAKNLNPPGAKTLKRFVSELEHNGVIPRREKRKRTNK